jgi:tRNA threonylcarbamoyladenosine biosynthesis protein TsaE
VRITLRSKAADETRAIGEAIAALLRPGDTLILTGELGAGKTTFVQGVAAGLGIDDPVTSPTFVLVHEHEGRLPLTHADVYRLRRVQDVLDLELVDEDRVLLVEWGDAIRDLLPTDHLRVELTASTDDEERRIVLEADATAWSERWSALSAGIGAWEGSP